VFNQILQTLKIYNIIKN